MKPKIPTASQVQLSCIFHFMVLLKGMLEKRMGANFAVRVAMTIARERASCSSFRGWRADKNFGPRAKAYVGGERRIDVFAGWGVVKRWW